MKRISILGCTGSVGRQTVEVVLNHKKDFRVVGLAAGSNMKVLKEQIKLLDPKIVSVTNKEDAVKLKKEFPAIKFVFGEDGIFDVTNFKESTLVVNALSGFLGFTPTLLAIEAGKDVALANKETIVVGGKMVMSMAKKNGVKILPVDSEHSAIFQALNGEDYSEIKKIILTASGGALRAWKASAMKDAKLEDVLKHPNWSMGQKITIDSATMFNKALEIIEARWLFDTKNIEVVIHRESIVHSMVTMKDNSVLAQLGVPSMLCPIQYALSYPKRLEASTKELDFTKVGSLTFDKVDTKKYPAIALAYKAIEAGGSLPIVLNAANEVAVELFVKEKIKFTDIAKIVDKAMSAHILVKNPSIKQIYEIDAKVRRDIGAKYV